MIERTNEFIYVKRYYFFPFKPLMDYEYKKFGFKKCDVNRGNEKKYNTAYYVRHKECPKGMCDFFYKLNLPLSYFRALVAPALLAIFLISMLIEGTIGINLLLAEQMLLLVCVFPAMLASVFLSNLGYDAYQKNDTDGKLDRIMNSRGWTKWTSYDDNDPRFTPPGSENATKTVAKKNPTTAPKSNTKPKNSNNATRTIMDPTIEQVSLISAKGEKILFNKIAVIIYRGKLYAIMQPDKLIEGMTEDEALVFKVAAGEDGTDKFEIELDDAIIDGVFKEYDRLHEEALRH